MAKHPAVPAASRPAFAAASHLTLLEPDRIGYRDVAYVGGGRYHFYVGTPPTAGATKQEREAAREAFYAAPDAVVTAKELAELVRGAFVSIGDQNAELAGGDRELTYYRAGAKPGGHRVLDRGRLVYVGRTYDDCRQVMGIEPPAPVDYSTYVMRFEVRTRPTLKGGRWGGPIIREGGGELERVVEIGNVATSTATTVTEATQAPEPLADVVPIRADVVDPYGRTVAAVDLDTATTDMHNTAQQQADEPEPVPAPTPVATIGHTALGQLPPAAEEWLARLIHPPKRTYARAYLEHLANGAPPPADPGDEWARKARTRAQRILNH